MHHASLLLCSLGRTLVCWRLLHSSVTMYNSASHQQSLLTDLQMPFLISDTFQKTKCLAGCLCGVTESCTVDEGFTTGQIFIWWIKYFKYLSTLLLPRANRESGLWSPSPMPTSHISLAVLPYDSRHWFHSTMIFINSYFQYRSAFTLGLPMARNFSVCASTIINIHCYEP